MAGIPTLIFGLLFDSYLGVPLMQNLNLIEKPFLPDPIKDSSVLAGISVPTLLLMCLGMGVIHIMASLCVSAIIQFKNGKIIDGICDGLIMVLFLFGLFTFVLDGVIETINFGIVPIITMVGAVVLGAVTAGRHVKGFGKFTKGFGFVYGLINYMSDILSYARLYGLMLSGAQIAQIVSNQLALPMASNGIGGLIGCILIMFVGHAFNVAMGLLGAFIHGARLQYVEFFSHFYEGDGELFKPLGRNFEHIYLK
jgi:V/A-type H+-transporting ATPase subunit I